MDRICLHNIVIYQNTNTSKHCQVTMSNSFLFFSVSEEARD